MATAKPDVVDCCSKPDPTRDSVPGEQVTMAGEAVVLLEALECRGIGSNWLSGGIAVIPSIVQVDIALLPSGRILECRVATSCVSSPPPVPPPRHPMA
jgi:hypothetical protein